ncbi:MAG: DNA gyrase inhibitor YacG [Planctomycetaceae bacterium]|nr:DNA gyrase inhibitor YacG [Planctomycetaceae bacterium]
MATLQCPTCDVPFESDYSPAMPFCSDRCRHVDLGRWLNEEHGVTIECDPDAEHETAWMEEES